MARQDLEEEVWDNTISLNPVPSPDSLSQRLLQSQPLPGWLEVERWKKGLSGASAFPGDLSTIRFWARNLLGCAPDGALKC